MSIFGQKAKIGESPSNIGESQLLNINFELFTLNFEQQ